MGNDLKLHLKLHYAFGGSTSWLKDEIVKKRYDSFRYFLPVERKAEANIILEIYSLNGENEEENEKNEENKYLDIIYIKKIVGLVNIKKIICKDVKLNKNECNIVYAHLKKTYFEKTQTREKLNRER